jgi:hypothetical protein
MALPDSYTRPTPEGLKLLRKVKAQRHLCGSCFPTWTSKPGGAMKPRLLLYINIKALEEELNRPKDRRKFIKREGAWFHAACWKWLQSVRKELADESKKAKTKQ